MISLVLDNATRKADLERDGKNIITNDLLNTAVLVSLHTNRVALSDDPLPDQENTDRQGWWADAFDPSGHEIGSRLWLLRRSKATKETANQAKIYIEEALQWLIRDGVARSITVTTEVQAPDILAYRIQILKPDNASTPYDAAWRAHLAEL